MTLAETTDATNFASAVLFVNTKDPSFNNFYWIGLKLDDATSQFVWASGAAMSWTGWESSYPQRWEPTQKHVLHLPKML